MKLNYHPDTDSPYIDLVARPSADSDDVAEGIMLDVDSHDQDASSRAQPQPPR